MRYDQKDQESGNVEDRRGQGGGGMGGFPFPMGGGGGMSLTTMLIVGALMLLFGFNPLDLLKGGGPGVPNMPQMPRMDPRTGEGGGVNIPGLPGGGQRSQVPAAQDDMKVFVSRVLKDTEDVWERVFQSFGRKYTKPPLVIFSGATRTACGVGQSAMGPFYCPADQKIYVDLVFYDELKRRFQAPGDFAQAYVIAHEVGHHVQTLLGIADRVQEMKSRVGQREQNQIQVRMELQADCLAGVWAALNHQMKNRIEQGDIEEGLNAAAQIGDDMIQKKTQGRVVPDAFTHGSSAQRVKWFRQGMSTGQIQSCDAFSSNE
ncbi:MAG: metalloprotease [Hyphomicrobiaceae bacterium]|nr:metalloprotease [Hyphomicrobiaceae bacterium]